MTNLSQKRCVPCEGGASPLGLKEINNYHSQLKDGWEVIEGKKVQRLFVFADFKEAIRFVNAVAEIAEKENHHPDISIHYNKVEIILWTHTIKGLSENDFILAAKIDGLS